jgi:ketosteroid isomerase-like protein
MTEQSSSMPETPEAVRAEILRLDEEWAEAAGARDVERTVSYWADDAVVFPPGMKAVVGKAAIRDYVRGGFATPGFSITWKTTHVVLSSAADFAYGTGSNRVTYSDPDGRVVTAVGKAVTVWRKDPAGWKCVIDIWNEAPAD